MHDTRTSRGRGSSPASSASNTFTAPSKSTAFVRASPPLPPAPALKYTTSAPRNASVKSAVGESSSERTRGVAPAAWTAPAWAAVRMIDVTRCAAAVRSAVRRSATLPCPPTTTTFLDGDILYGMVRRDIAGSSLIVD
ncbi:unnamed protein product [Mycena citricolor]|uniref:Uncharacterized protein n=1 Tax=Mycena citricolor TaxID=2018698 RepID=A0AAD2Q3G9_9AGAR|nr:unnamed protein product [Mycena citricolor]